MGIHNFYFNWLVKSNFVNIFRQNFPSVSSLSIDVNSIFHETAQLIYAYGDWGMKFKNFEKGEFLKKQRLSRLPELSDQQLEIEHFNAIAAKLSEIVHAVNPTDYLLIAVDGTAPQAKISQQRFRRFKNALSPGSFQGDNDIMEGFIMTPNIQKRFDPNCITPGTEYMKRLDLFLVNFFRENAANLCSTVYYSPHTVPGEGEHKIMNHFRNDIIGGDGYHVIYGMDSDLILLALALDKPRILLWREDIINKLDIDALGLAISDKLGSSVVARTDFILIMNLFGNDFLPAIPAYVNIGQSLDKVIELYLVLYETYGLTYTYPKNHENYGKINWSNLLYFFKTLQENESYHTSELLKLNFIQKESLKYATQKDGEPINFDLYRFRDYWYYSEFYPKGNPDNVTKFITSNINDNLERITDMADNYLEGIKWVYNYYILGSKNVNLNWYYKNYKAPLIHDLYNSLYDIHERLSRNSIADPQEHNVFMNPYQQLMSVIPYNSINVLPHELKFFMTSDSPIIDYYPIDYLIDLELKDKDYKGIPIIPFVDPQRIKKAFGEYLRYSFNEVKYFIEGKDREFTRSSQLNEMVCNDQLYKSAIKKEIKKQGPRVDRKRFNPRYKMSEGTYDTKPKSFFKL